MMRNGSKNICNEEKPIYCAAMEGDYYTGTKKALIAGGICKAHWFPARLAKDGQGRTKRTYRPEGVKRQTTLTHRRDVNGAEYWVVRIEIDEEEQARREQERERKLEARRQAGERYRIEWEKQRREAGESQPKAAEDPPLLRPVQLAPFVPGSITEHETQHLRALRALSDRQYEMILDLTWRLMESEEAKRQHAEENANPKRNLRIVVDNTR